jgi:hypothetical protein
VFIGEAISDVEYLFVDVLGSDHRVDNKINTIIVEHLLPPCSRSLRVSALSVVACFWREYALIGEVISPVEHLIVDVFGSDRRVSK